MLGGRGYHLISLVLAFWCQMLTIFFAMHLFFLRFRLKGI